MFLQIPERLGDWEQAANLRLGELQQANTRWPKLIETTDVAKPAGPQTTI